MEQEIRFIKNEINDIWGMVNEYRNTISIPYDDFLEGYILRSNVYTMFYKNAQIGFIGILQQLVTVLYVSDTYLPLSNQIVESVQKEFHINTAFIPTTDLCAVSIFFEHFKKIEIQALHFTDSKKRVRPPEYSKDNFSLAVLGDREEIIEIAGDFMENWNDKIYNHEVYVLRENGSIIGIGVLTRNIIMNQCMGTGMFTKQDMRCKGVGRSIILHLKDIVYGMGKIPVPGCWYYNTNSRKTLESAGYITKSKLLKISL